MNIKNIIGLILILASIIGLLACVVFATVFYFQNPDMTELRRFIEYPEPTIGAVVCMITMYWGKYFLEDKKH